MKEIKDPKDLIRGKNYYILKASEDSGRKVINQGKALGVHFNGIVEYDENKHAYPEDGAVLGLSTGAGAFRKDEPLVTFKQVIPLNPKGDSLAKVTHFKPYHTHQTDYKRYLGYKFYEVTTLLRLEDIISKQAIKKLSSKHLESAPFLKHLNERDIQEYLGIKSSPPHHSKSHHNKSHHSKSHHSKSHHSKSPGSTKSNSKKGGKIKKRGRRTRKKSHNRNTKRLLH